MPKANHPEDSRLIAGVQRFQPILCKAKLAGKNESDTVTIIVDMLSEVFGFDKYEQITSELQIKRTFCDLAIKIDGKVCLLIECKASISRPFSDILGTGSFFITTGAPVSSPVNKYSIEHPRNSQIGIMHLDGGSVFRCFQFDIVAVLTPMLFDRLYAVNPRSFSSSKSRSQIVISSLRMIYRLTKNLGIFFAFSSV